MGVVAGATAIPTTGWEQSRRRRDTWRLPALQWHSVGRRRGGGCRFFAATIAGDAPVAVWSWVGRRQRQWRRSGAFSLFMLWLWRLYLGRRLRQSWCGARRQKGLLLARRRCHRRCLLGRAAGGRQLRRRRRRGKQKSRLSLLWGRFRIEVDIEEEALLAVHMIDLHSNNKGYALFFFLFCE